jgi:hypothetical protein
MGLFDLKTQAIAGLLDNDPSLFVIETCVKATCPNRLKLLLP